MVALDHTKPLATLLREGTKEAHTAVENSQGAKLLLSGNLAKREYIRYLIMLYYVYDTLEKALDKHAVNPAIEPTYNPTLLARAPALASDIAYLLQSDEESWKAHPIHQSLVSPMPPALSEYVTRLQTLADSENPAPLVAHSYVRYLGDLSGGQMIRHTIAKAYDLDEASGEGIAFYAFKELASAKPAGLGEMRRIKEWFRDGLNATGEIDPQVKGSIVKEASLAFDLNSGLFSSIDLVTIADETALKKSKRRLEVLDEEDVSGSKSYSFSTVVAVIAAVSIAHFCLVVGGFTGDKSYEKLAAVNAWLARMW